MSIELSVLAFALLISAGSLPGAGRVAPGRDLIMFIGTYTEEPSKGIYAFRFEPTTGQAKPIGLVAETENPSFIAIHPNQRFLYAANEISTYAGEPTGSISAFAIDAISG